MAVARSRSTSGGLTSYIRLRALSLWTNAVNAQLVPIRFSPAAPVWILGVAYGNPDEFRDGKIVLSEQESSRFQMICRPAGEILSDVRSRFYFTYREDFEVLPLSDLSSDVGWGCMVRVGQMLMAQTLVLHLLSREWRVDGQGADASSHRAIIRLFGDTSDPQCPFSIHNLLRHLQHNGVKPGDWLGPSSVGRALCEVVNQDYARVGGPALRAYFAADCLLSRSQVMAGGAWVPLLVLVPLRLGLRGIAPCYMRSLKALFELPQFLGIMGGRPRHALFFFGIQGDDFIALDPHHCRTSVDVSDPEFPVESYHSTLPRKLPFTAADPSMCLGFYCHLFSDFSCILAFLSNKSLCGDTPLVSVME